MGLQYASLFVNSLRRLSHPLLNKSYLSLSGCFERLSLGSALELTCNGVHQVTLSPVVTNPVYLVGDTQSWVRGWYETRGC